MIKKENRGFTLIELLVVIAIIGLLSSVVLASLNNARKKGRDARRVSDMKQLQVALELYYSDVGSYPALTTANTTKAAFDTALAALAGAYIPTIPADPSWSSGTTPTYFYRTTTGGTFYCLGATLETTPLPPSSCNTGSTGLGSAFTGGGNYQVGP